MQTNKIHFNHYPANCGMGELNQLQYGLVPGSGNGQEDSLFAVTFHALSALLLWSKLSSFKHSKISFSQRQHMENTLKV